MPEWWEQPYPGGPAVTTTPLPRPLYPSDAKGYGPSEPGDDVTAAKRVISRLGRWPWQSDGFSPEYTKEFSHGKAGGNVKDSGVAGYQRQMNLGDSGYVGDATYNSWRNARIPEPLPNAGQPAMDATAIALFEKAWQKYKGAPKPPSSKPTQLTRKAMPSPNYSSRRGSTVRLIVLHTAEGALTIESLGSFFANPNASASSHTGIDDKAGVIGEYVKRSNKAWTAARANPIAVQTELCAFARWSRSDWNTHPNMLENCARWIAEEAAVFDIPIVRLAPSQAQSSGRGVCQHADLGSMGGGHWDCGSGFPMAEVLARAKEWA